MKKVLASLALLTLLGGCPTAATPPTGPCGSLLAAACTRIENQTFKELCKVAAGSAFVVGSCNDWVAQNFNATEDDVMTVILDLLNNIGVMGFDKATMTKSPKGSVPRSQLRKMFPKMAIP